MRTTRTLPSTPSAYAVALAATAAAVALRWLVDPWMANHLPFVTLFGAVAVAVWYGGLGPAVVATILGFAACSYLFVDSRSLFGVETTSGYIAVALYLFTSSLVIGIGLAMKLAERRIREGRELLMVTFASIGDAVITTDIDGRVTYVNSVAESITGWSAADARGKPLDTVFRIADEQSGQPADNPATTAVREGRIVALANHTVLFARDGARRPIEDSAAPIRNAEGRIIGCVLIFRDVTASREAEKRLRASQAELSEEAEALARLNDACSRLWRMTELNEGLDEMLAATVHLLGADMGNVQLVNPDGNVLVIAAQRGLTTNFLEFFREVSTEDPSACGRALRSHERLIIEDVEADLGYAPLRSVAREAGYRSVQSTPLTGRDGKLLGVISTHWRTPHRPTDAELRRLDLYARQAADFIERCRTEETLQRAHQNLQLAEQRSRAFLENSAIIAWLKDEEGRNVFYSDNVVRRFGLVDWHNKTDFELWPRDIAEAFRKNDLAVLERESPFECVEEVRTLSGDVSYWLNSKFWFRGADGKRYVGGVGVDITERKKAEDALIDAERRKDEFLATLAHELRNPLAPLRNGLEVLRRTDNDYSLSEKTRAMMERQVAQMTRLVDDLLDISRITVGKLQLHKKSVDIADVLSMAVETVRPLVEASGHELAVAEISERITVQADPIRLAQVFANLLNNAVKYTDGQGRIWVTAERRGNEAIVSVRDTGIGIASEKLQEIFEIFSQASPAIEQSRGGLGIGLSLAKGLVELHGGRIEASSGGLGKGSEFTVRLPVASPTADSQQPSADEKPIDGARKFRVLVVDDLRDAADTLSMVLRMIGHETHTAYDGVEAVQAVAAFKPDIVFLDIGLPKMSGYDAARTIRAQPHGKNVTLIALTGWGQAEDRRRAVEAGFDQHLTKPVDPGAVELLVARLGSSRATPLSH